MLSAVKFVHPWETNAVAAIKRGQVETYKAIITDYRQLVVGNLNRQCTESLAKHSLVVCTSSSAQLDVV